MIDARTEQRLLELAVSRGLLTEDEAASSPPTDPVAADEGSPSTRWGQRLGAHLAAGRLDEPTLDKLVAELARTEPTRIEVPWRDRSAARPDGEPGGPRGDEETAATPRIAAGIDWQNDSIAPEEGDDDVDFAFLGTWDRYQVVGFLGAGGMGRVYRAYDPSLNRYLALKFLRWNETVQVERFMREARAQARVEHDNVCKVFEVGRVERRPYIAMQYIDGVTLSEGADVLSLEHKVRILRDVAMAVHAAHRQGLIHRDLKPGNILLEKQEDGSWHPYVVDFGLAQDQGADGLTRTGAVTGTPSYLSPEQAQALPLDRRSDVYSLGVVLFEVLSGAVPLSGTSVGESLIKVITEEPPPLIEVNPRVPRDLSTVVMKCLDKEPERRYASARALAEDLDRFLDGEPIEARPPSRLYRFEKWVLKNKELAAVLAIAVVTVTVLSAVLLWRAERRAEVAQRFGQEVSTIESEVRYAFLLPLHDISGHKAVLRQRMDDIRSEMESLGGLAGGPGHLALGRGYLALHDYDEALSHLQQAWELGERSPELTTGLGRALGALYQKQLLELGDPSPNETIEQSQRELDEQVRAQALEYLKSGQTADEADYARALTAFFDRRYEDALAHAERAVAARPWLTEVQQLIAEVYIERGDAEAARGDYDRALECYDDAGRAYAKLLEAARSDPTAHAAECRRGIRVLMVDSRLSTFSTAAAREALAHCGHALQVDPDFAEAYTQQAHIYWLWGEAERGRGEDPSDLFEAAITASTRAIELNPKEVLAHSHRGVAYRQLASQKAGEGLDPLPDLNRAISDFERAIAINPRLAQTHNRLGNAYLTRGQHEMGLGLDPRGSLARAVASYQQTLELEPDFAIAYVNRATALASEAEFAIDHGRSPGDLLAEAIASLERAIELNPNRAGSHNNLANAYMLEAEHRLLRGEDPSSALESARHCLQRAGEINPDYNLFAYNLGFVEKLRSTYLLAAEQDPSAAIQAARTAFADAERMLGPDPDVYLEMVRVELLAARAAMAEGDDPRPHLERARQPLAWEWSKTDPRYLLAEAEVERWNLEWAARRGRAAVVAERALAAASAASTAYPDDAEVQELEGVVHRLAALAADGEERRRLAAAAADCFARAIELNGHLERRCAELLAEMRELAARQPALAVAGGSGG